MQPMDEFLSSVESRLRCPAERRPSVMEELRAHLADQVEALLQQGHSQTEAEQQAVREMMPAWLLALRLSATNGWSLSGHILRESGAMALGFFLLVGGLNAGMQVGNNPWVPLWMGYAGLSLLLLVLGFSLGRIVRGWVWALAIMALIAAAGGFSGDSREGFPFVLLFTLAGIAGSRRKSPRLTWLTWASGSIMMLWWFAWETRKVAESLAIDPWTVIASRHGLPVPARTAIDFQDVLVALRVFLGRLVIGPGAWFFWLCVLATLLLWLAARFLDARAKLRLPE